MASRALSTLSDKSKRRRFLLEKFEPRTLFSVHTWTGGGGINSTGWSDATNWIGGVPESTEVNCDLVFPDNGTILGSVNNIVDLNPRNITFNGSGYNLVGVPFQGITGTISTTKAGSTNNLGIRFVMTNSITVDTGASSTLTISGSFNALANIGITKTGTGTLVLSAANSYPGITTIAAGTLIADSQTALGAGAAGDTTQGTVIEDGATLELRGNGRNIGTETISVTGDGVGNAGAIIVDRGTSASASATLGGAITLTGNTTIGVSTGDSLAFSGALSGTDTLTQIGGGTLAFIGGGTYSGTLTSAGKLVLASSLTSMNIHATGPVSGIGTFANMDLSGGGALDPGTPAVGTVSTTVATLNTGDFTLDADSSVHFDIGSNAGFDQVVVTGAVDLTGAAFSASLFNSFNPANLATFTLIDNDGTADPVTGTFAGLAEGAAVTISGKAFTISYAGGDGNDVVLTRTAFANTATVTASTNTPVKGQQVTLTATVLSSGTPTGPVTFLNGTTNIGTATLASNGTAQISLISLPVGTDAITVQYNGDSDNAGATSPVLNMTVSEASITLALTGQAIVGINKPMTVTVTGALVSPSVLPVSNLTGLSVDIMEGATVLGTVTIGANGVITGSITFSTGGPHTVFASFAGDADFNAATSSDLVVTAQDTVFYAAGTGPGVKNILTVYNVDGTIRYRFAPFAANYTGGMSVAVGDVNGDGIPDIIVGSGAGMVPDVRIYNGASDPNNPIPDLIMHFNPGAGFGYTASYRGGVYVAAGDINADGKDDIIVGPKTGQSALVNVFNVSSLLPVAIRTFTAFTKYQGGVHVASGHIDGDANDDIIVAPATAAVKDVKVISGLTGLLIKDFTPYLNAKNVAVGFANGIFVAAGDVDGDGLDDIITGQGGGAKAKVNVFTATDFSNIRSFQPYVNGYAGGIRVASHLINGDGNADILTITGGGGKALLNIFDGADLTVPPANIRGLNVISPVNNKNFTVQMFIG